MPCNCTSGTSGTADTVGTSGTTSTGTAGRYCWYHQYTILLKLECIKKLSCLFHGMMPMSHGAEYCSQGQGCQSFSIYH